MWRVNRQPGNYGRALLIAALILSALVVATLSSRKGDAASTGIEPGDAGQSSSSRDRLIEPGKPIKAGLSNNEAQSYRITLDAGQYLRLAIEQWGAAILVRLFAPNDRLLTEVNCRDGSATLSLIAETSGDYRIEVHSPEKDSDTRRFEIRVEEIRQTNEKDQDRISAERAFEEGERLRTDWIADSHRRAIKKYEEALSLWRACGEGRKEIDSLNEIAETYQQLGEPRQALKYYQDGLRLAQKVNDVRAKIEALNGIGYVHLSLGENQKALTYCSRALDSSRSTGHRPGEAQALNNIGETHYASGSLQKSLDYYHQSLALWREINDLRGQAQALMNVGYTYSDLSETQKAFDFYHQARVLWQRAGDHRGEALTLTALGHLYSKLGEKQNALDLYQQALRRFQPMEDRMGQAFIFNGMGYVYDQLNEPERALEYYNQARQLFQAVGYRYGQAGSLWKIGQAYFSLGDYDQALAYYRQSLAISRDMSDPRMQSIPVMLIGQVYESSGNKKEALEYYRRALRLNRAGGDRREEAYTLNNIGHVYEDLGEKQKALACYTQAIPLNRSTEDRFGESLTTYNIAHVERDLGNLAEARARMETALGIIESLRTKVASQNLRTSYFASVRQHYELYTDVLMQLHKQRPSEGHDVTALEASERARARSLLETLTEARADLSVDVDAGLLERERSLQQLLDDKAERQTRLLGGKHTEDEAAAIAREIDDITVEYDEVRAQIRAANPHYAALTQPQPLSFKEIQQQVLDDDTLLLEYALGDERSYLWAATRDSIYGYELPKRAEIETAARRVYELLRAHQPVPGETLAQRQARAADADAQYWQEAVALSRMILGPVAGQLGNKRLLIVADGALQYIPFGALMGTEGDTQARANGTEHAREPVPLILDHEIANLPSASTLAVLRRETAQRAPAPNAVAVLADPVFEKDDPRIPIEFRAHVSATVEQKEAERTEVAELHRAVRDAGAAGPGGSIPRLLASREEAEAIMRVTPAGAGLNAIGFDASRATATSPELGKYRIVHFATHGLLNSEHPELSGVILSLVNQQGQPVNGFLRLHDIYNLSLPADLVVLSACNTGLGKDVKGEGLIGLTRGFMYAGASSVMASLWKVDDEATAELMKHFYRGVLKDGLPPSSALRQAQVEMWRQKPWRSPYYWAAFVLQGEYGQRIEIKGQSEVSAGQIVTAGALILTLSVGGGLYAVKRRRRNLVYTNPR